VSLLNLVPSSLEVSAEASTKVRSKVQGVLFDLDGTFADTAPDMGRALNTILTRDGRATIPLTTLRPFVSQGARGMIGVGYGVTPDHAEFSLLRDAFLAEYQRAICIDTEIFDGIDALTAELETRGIKWGIVTNKAMRFTDPLARALGLNERAACIVSGDTCARAKPHPDPLLHAAKLIDVAPTNCLYIGDDERDIQAAHAAGMRGVIALYGYLGGTDPATWQAPIAIAHPRELTAHL
jgi:N-acetyl-D-muramate 6-phosphate phosphatase